MTVGLVGDDSAVDAVRASLEDVDAPYTSIRVSELDTFPIGVVSDVAGAGIFERANERAMDAGRSWFSIELGGIGGRSVPGVDAAMAGFGPGTGCFSCLRTRVSAALDDPNGNTDAGMGDGQHVARLAGAVVGSELISLLRGDESTLIGGVIELPYGERTVLPVPGCPVCNAGDDGEPELVHEARPLEESLRRAELALDERVGIVTTVGEVESFPVPYYLATNAETLGFSDASAASQAAGVSDDWNAAFMKALGESLERYSAGIYRVDDFTHAMPADLEGAVPPERFVGPKGGEYRSGDDSDETTIPWVAGRNLETRERSWIPAEFVHFPPPERRYRPAITTGLGLGNSPVDACLSGLYEVVERDATMLAWYSTYEPLELEVSCDRFEELVRRAESVGLDVTALLVTQDVDVPVVTVAVHRDGAWPRFAVGSGANLDPDDAAVFALCEALQNWVELRSIGRDEAAEESGWIGRYAEFPDAARRFVSVETSVPADDVGPSDPPSGPPELDALVDRLVQRGLSAHVAWITPRDVRSLGFEAARVVVPESQPLFTGQAYFGERARRVPSELGFEPRLEREPHPYP